MTTEKTISDRKRLYQVWKGKNFLDLLPFPVPRLIFGPYGVSSLLTALMIVAPYFVFFFQTILKIKARANHVHGDPCILGFPVLIVGSIITLSDLVFLFITSSSDPGIIPRNSRLLPDHDSASSSMMLMYGKNSGKTYVVKDVVVNNFIVRVKYCETCLLFRPPRASHCSVCNNCVQKFDHHCPWFGQCIGLRNYRFFFLFISTSTFLCLYVFTFSSLNIIEQIKHDSLSKAMKREVLSLILIIYTFVAVWFVGGLTLFHLHLIFANQSTYENYRHLFDEKENPYDKGILGNIKEVFFSSIPPSLINFRSFVVEEPVEVGSRRPSITDDINIQKEKIANDTDSMDSADEVGIPNILKNLDYSGISINSDDTKSYYYDREV